VFGHEGNCKTPDLTWMLLLRDSRQVLVAAAKMWQTGSGLLNKRECGG
jgi:hypothetical protein